MNAEQAECIPARRVWRRVGMLALIVVVTAGLIALGLVLTGIIAEPETVMITIGRWVFGR
jgi:hypothetical protein